MARPSGVAKREQGRHIDAQAPSCPLERLVRRIAPDHQVSRTIMRLVEPDLICSPRV